MRIDKGEDRGKYRVEVCGFDSHIPRSGTIDSGGTEMISIFVARRDREFEYFGDKVVWQR